LASRGKHTQTKRNRKIRPEENRKQRRYAMDDMRYDDNLLFLCTGKVSPRFFHGYSKYEGV
jgi:hypothetical protein